MEASEVLPSSSSALIFWWALKRKKSFLDFDATFHGAHKTSDDDDADDDATFRADNFIELLMAGGDEGKKN